MTFITRILVSFTVTLALLFITVNTFAANDAVDIPEPLKPWQDWVLYGLEDSHCPFSYNNYQNHFCAWPTTLTLDLGKTGGRFEQRWEVYKKSWVRLPGSIKYWPSRVTVNNKNAIVTQRQGYPVVMLEPGQAHITGRFYWDQIPESLSIDSTTGLVDLEVNNKKIVAPHIDNEGRLWLSDSSIKAAESTQQEDVLTVKVFRKLIDDVPFFIVTRLDINVSGDQREVLLKNVLIDNTIPTELHSQLPARLEPNGDLRMQVRPGQWQIEITTRFVNAVNQLRMPQTSPPLPPQEIWVFDARSHLRVVEVEGVTPIDPRQTNLPTEWKSLPTYRVKPDDRFELIEVRRGNPQPEPNQLQLQRTLWLDFDGKGYTVKDRITGNMRRGWRLNASEELDLGRVIVNGQPQLITSLEGSPFKGVEVRQGQLDVVAVSRYEASRHDLPVGGWHESFQKIETTLNLPPGWRLFSASGVDNTPNTWLQSWTLLDLFLVLILSMAVFRLWNWQWGIIALVTFTLIWQEPVNAPRYVWLNVFIAIALLRVVPANRLRTVIASYRNLSLLALIIISVPFMVNEVRNGIYPQLEQPLHSFMEPMQAPVSPMEGMLDQAPNLAQSSSRSKMPRSLAAPEPEAAPPAPSIKKLARLVDPNATLQTGPGLPDWDWDRIYLSWTGPSDQQQRTQLYLVSPAANMLLNFIRVGFLLALFMLVFEVRGKLKLPGSAAKAMLLLFSLTVPMTLLPTNDANAAFPDDKLLSELKQRLTRPPDCLPNCASVPDLAIDISTTRLQLTSAVHAHQQVAIPLAARADQWMPDTVTLDGKRVRGLYRTGDGVLWISVGAGIHTIKLSGSSPDRSYFQLPLLLKPHHVSVKTRGWTVDGVSINGVPDSQIQFSRIQKQLQNKEFTQLQAGPLPPFVRVERTLMLGLEWRVRTTIHRVSASNVPVIFELPLINGEAVLDENIKVEEGKAIVSLASTQDRLSWLSSLKQQPSITLDAAKTDDWIEVWRLDVSPIWHVTMEGIPVIHHQGDDRHWMPEWHPYPGETVEIKVTRPQSVHGRSLTIDRSVLSIVPGSRVTESHLSFNIRSSQGAQHTIVLPNDATLSEVRVNNVLQNIRQEGRRVTLPVNPGASEFDIRWRVPTGIQNYYISEQVDLGIDSVNNNIQLQLPQDRWTLLTAGPRLGPAVLYWGVVIIVLILSAILAFTKITPLRTWQWALLGIGLSQVHIAFALIVVGWLILFGLREKLVDQAGKLQFNSMQIALALLTIVALLVLFYAVQQGLLGRPDMQIAGNGSTAYALNWYQDRVPKDLPQVWVLSVPLIIYRILMLLWALWLAYSVLGWLRWAWQQYSIGGYWRRIKGGNSGQPAKSAEQPEK